MFAKALKSVSVYTYPVIISQRLYDGKVKCACATFIVLNEEGWILTSAHVLAVLDIAKKHSIEYSDYKKRKAEIETDLKLNIKQKNKKIKRLPVNKQWIINQSYWWGKDGVTIKNFHIDGMADLATGRLEPFDSKSISVYPTFKDPKKGLSVGTSLCRLGFPFHNINATFDEDKKSFQIAPGVLPMPRFPLEGIHTRVAIFVDEKSKRKSKFIETSSPGLRGQSGGPIFDIHGNIWGLQSRTSHFALGFKPKVKHGNKETEENQFLNVGLGTHVEEISHFLTDNKIKFNLST